MPKAKPLMMPEQQEKFKKAVAQGALETRSYSEYCKITPEDAEKMLKSVENKVDSTRPLRGRKAPEAPAPAPEKTPEVPKTPSRSMQGADEPATKFQKRAISDAVKAGDMEALPEGQWKALTKGEASRIIGELHAKQPPAPATEPQMQEIDRLVKEGRIYPMKSETYNHLSKDKASTLISIGRMNAEKDTTVEGYDPNYVSRRNQPKTPEQEAELKRLVAENRLNPVPREKWGALTQGEAGKLIYIGQQRESRQRTGVRTGTFP